MGILGPKFIVYTSWTLGEGNSIPSHVGSVGWAGVMKGERISDDAGFMWC